MGGRTIPWKHTLAQRHSSQADTSTCARYSLREIAQRENATTGQQDQDQ